MDVTTYKGCVYPWQCDHVGHMNIMWYVSKFDEANWNLFATLGLTPSYLRSENRGMAAVQQNITYKREMIPGDIVEVRSRVLELGEKSVRFVHEMRNGETEEVAALCELTGVYMDRLARKAVAFPIRRSRKDCRGDAARVRAQARQIKFSDFVSSDAQVERFRAESAIANRAIPWRSKLFRV